MSEDRLSPLNDLFSGMSEEPEDTAPEQSTPEAQPEDAEAPPRQALPEIGVVEPSAHQDLAVAGLPLDLFSSDEGTGPERPVDLPTDLFSSDETEEPVSKPEVVVPEFAVPEGQDQDETLFDLVGTVVGKEDQTRVYPPEPPAAAPIVPGPDLVATATPERVERLGESREYILNVLLGGATVGGGIAVAALIAASIGNADRLLAYLPFFVGYVLIVVAFAFRRIAARWRTVILIGVAYAVSLASLFRGGATGTGAWYLVVIPLLFFVLVGERPGMVSGVVNIVIYAGFGLAHRIGWLVPSLPPIATSTSQMLVFVTSFVLVAGILVVVQTLFQRSQRRVLRSLEEQSSRLRQTQRAGSRREEELARLNDSLRRQAAHFELGEQIGHVAAMGLETTEFAERVVALVCERTAADYAGLFLLDDDREYALLRAFAGVGQTRLSARQQRLRVDDEILLRQCVSSGQARVLIGIDKAQNLAEEGGGLFLLAETRSAVTLPLIARGHVSGVLSLQSHSPSGFGNDDLVSLRAVVDQIATAVSNAQLTEELRRRLQEMATLQQYYVREAWEQFLSEEREQIYEFDQPGVASLDRGSILPEIERVLAQPELMILEEGEASAPSALVSPISLRDQVLGVLGLHRETADEPWTDDQIELIAAISEQMGLIIENSRLFSEARARATRERQAREITARMRESLNVEMVLQTAAREIGQTLQLHDVTIELTDSPTTEAER